MSWLSLFDCSGLHAAKRIHARSFSIGLAMCAALAIWPIERAGAADWPLRGSLAPQTTYARWDGWQFGVEAGWGNFRNRFWQQHQPARRLYLAKYDRGIRIRPVDLDNAAVEHHERSRVWRLYRLQHAMGSTRPRCGSRIQIPVKHCDRVRTIRSARQFTTSDSIQHIGQQSTRAPRSSWSTMRLCAGAPAMPGANSCLMRWSVSPPVASIIETTATVNRQPAHQFHLRQAIPFDHHRHRRATAKTNAIVGGVARRALA